jgi:hypothetical protein
MAAKKVIEITCKGQKYVPHETLKEFQGNLKILPPAQQAKLRAELLKYGFSFPVFVWKDWILDGHQRIDTLKGLIDDGYRVGDIPVVEIEASSRKEAAEKLLLVQSKYGQITDEGLVDFVEKFDLDFESIYKDLDLPDIKDLDAFFDEHFAEIGPEPIAEPAAEGIGQLDNFVTVKIISGAQLWVEHGTDILKRIEKSIEPYSKSLTLQVTE